MDLNITFLPGQLLDIQSADTLSDHDIVSGTLKNSYSPHIRYKKGDYGSMRSDALKFEKETYFNGYSNNMSVQENFNLITSFIQDSVDTHILSKTCRSIFSVPNELHLKEEERFAGKMQLMQRLRRQAVRKLDPNREIKAGIRKQHELLITWLVI